jgi:phosphotransferase system enzyme I (PtsI)
MRRFRGIGASPGLIMGPARVWHRQALRVDWQAQPAGDAAHEHERLEHALSEARAELERVRAQLRERLGQSHAQILDAQLLMLEDEEFLQKVREGIARDGLSAEAAFTRSMAEALIPLDLSGDGLFRERMTDFRDIEQRVVRALTGGVEPVPRFDEPCVLVSSQLSPSETASVDLSRVLGFCIDEGGDKSHTAIIARGLGVPAVVALRDASTFIQDGDVLAVDGGTGLVHVDPDPSVVKRFEARIRRRRSTEERLLKIKDYPAETRDGRRVELSANIELPQEIELALANGAKGIGLVRTEYFYFRSSSLPSEDQQLESYRDVLTRARGETVIFRVLDVGGDKILAAMGGMREYNPFLGLRGARYLLENPEILRTQLRALYRASESGPMKLMFPMVCGLEELRAFNRHCRDVREELHREGACFDAELEVGIMIETPSAVAMAPELARECDFFSVGSNDLTQYVLAVDRTNRRVSHLHQSHHPAVLRSIRDAIQAGHEAGIWVGLCGEMGGHPLQAVLLVGMGIDEISTHASTVPMIKKVIRTISFDQAKTWAEEALRLPTAEEVDEFLRARAFEHLREFLGNGR